jgi:AcrR family transcriptional regulator
MSDQMRSPKRQKPRAYRLQRRAEKRDETHHALARAAFELHNSVGPSRTTVTAIAERAGVQRLTVYRHFPDEEAIFAACSAYSFAEDPPPNPDAWAAVEEPRRRLRTALREVYGYYLRKSRLLTNLYRDAEMPVVAAALSRRKGVLARGVAILAKGWRAPGAKAERLMKAAMAHALDFSTWRSLVEGQELTVDEAVDVMLTFVEAALHDRTIGRSASR